MSYEDALEWVKDNKEQIQNDALGGVIEAEHIVKVHRLLVRKADVPTSAIFTAAVADYRFRLGL